MKSLLVSLLLVTFTQTTFAAPPPPLPMDLNEADSKLMYNTLAEWGTRLHDPAEKRTLEHVTDVLCSKDRDDNYGCKMYDQLHGAQEYRKAGEIAKRLYFVLGVHRGITCGIQSGICGTTAPVIKCTHWWNNKHNPPIRLYQCRIENFPSIE